MSSSVKRPGWFSRRYQTSEGLEASRTAKDEKEFGQHQAAQERAAAADERTPEQQISRLNRGGFEAKKERKRLLEKIEAAK